MVKRRAAATINRSADEVWARVRDFGDISWVPKTEECTVYGDERRVSRRDWDFVLVQRLVEHDDAKRTYSYTLPDETVFDSLLGPGHTARLLDGTIAVSPDGPTRATVTWDVDTEEFLINGVHAEYQNALESLKAELEA
jgi:hypothetical protein